MTDPSTVTSVAARHFALPSDIGQVVLVPQDGGALGACQVGVYQTLHEAGVEPDGVIGTSIGAINASLIAGNDPVNRMSHLKDFCRVQRELYSTQGGLQVAPAIELSESVKLAR
jgi:NTE family protein